MIESVRVHVPRRRAVELPRLRNAMERTGKVAAGLLYERVAIDGKDSSGRPLPKVKKARWTTTTADPRWKGISRDRLAFRYVRGSRGVSEPQLRVALQDDGGYRGLKQRVNRRGRTHRGSDLSGKMWRSMKISAEKHPRVPGAYVIRIFFAGSQVVGQDPTKLTRTGKPKKIRVRNRDKAYALQFPSRDANGEPSGTQDFHLMEFAQGELEELLEQLLSRIRFWGQ